MAVPKTLEPIDTEKAEKIIAKELKNGTGHWEGEPGIADFVYECGNRFKMIRPGFRGYETGIVSM